MGDRRPGFVRQSIGNRCLKGGREPGRCGLQQENQDMDLPLCCPPYDLLANPQLAWFLQSGDGLARLQALDCKVFATDS